LIPILRRGRTTAAVLVAILCARAVPAHADYLFTPFIGGAFAGSTVFHTEQPSGSMESSGTHLIFGGSAGWLSSGILGVEGDFAYSPRFFERDGLIVLASTVATVSGSVIVATPLRVTGYSLRPYLIGGLGLIHTGITYTAILDPVDDNSLGMNLGAGAIGLLSPRTGLRFELRHFRTFSRDVIETTGEHNARLSFWRVTFGVVIKR
jgi:outer membrane protein with beta-barrel domain